MADAEPQGMLPDLPPRPAPKPELSLVVPDAAHLLQLRERAREAEELPGLRKLVAAWQAAAEKCDLAFEELTRLAVYRLEVERDLGAHLAQTVHRGGHRAKSPRGSLLRGGCLPGDVTKKQSRLYQNLAKVPEPVFRAYLDNAFKNGETPTSAGARAFARAQAASGTTSRPRGGRRRRATAASVLPANVLACVERVMMPDCIVGDADLPAKLRLASTTAPDAAELRGDVFLARCDDPARWLRELARRRACAQIKRAIVVLPAAPWAEWFGQFESGDWLLCFLRDVRGADGYGVVLAHIGERPSAFRLAFGSLGIVLRAANSM